MSVTGIHAVMADSVLIESACLCATVVENGLDATVKDVRSASLFLFLHLDKWVNTHIACIKTIIVNKQEYFRLHHGSTAIY